MKTFTFLALLHSAPFATAAPSASVGITGSFGCVFGTIDGKSSGDYIDFKLTDEAAYLVSPEGKISPAAPLLNAKTPGEGKAYVGYFLLRMTRDKGIMAVRSSDLVDGPNGIKAKESNVITVAADRTFSQTWLGKKLNLLCSFNPAK